MEASDNGSQRRAMIYLHFQAACILRGGVLHLGERCGVDEQPLVLPLSFTFRNNRDAINNASFLVDTLPGSYRRKLSVNSHYANKTLDSEN